MRSNRTPDVTPHALPHSGVAALLLVLCLLCPPTRGSAETIGPGRDPEWSTDGTRLVYTHDGGLYVAEVGGGSPVRILDEGTTPAIWWNENTEIIFTRHNGAQTNLWIAGADGSNPRVRSTDSGSPAATPDSAMLLFWNNYDVNGNGSVDRCYLVFDYELPFQYRVLCNMGLSLLHWHPDGDRLVGRDHGRVVAVALPGEEVTYYDLLPDYAGLPQDILDVHIAPDGVRLAYERMPETIPPLNQIFIWQDGAELQLTDDLEICRGPRWSPDGTRIAYYATERVLFTDSIEIIDAPVTPTRDVRWSDLKDHFQR